MPRLPLLALFALALVTAGASAADARAGRSKAQARQVARGLDIARSHCAGCHAVTAGAISPDPEAPPWDAVINRPGLTPATLQAFLRDSHNYPAQMDFSIAPRHIADIAAYMMTLRQRNYRPPTQ